ncbi:hypothetical protein DPMN_092240 [Dreissena polymorpha]|uniref:Uncharacterized protein n=1 Tax=Dreissena polymorpha TaxID=45954 RepID=A0A9D4L3K1_DREPO|nr:hypothetical protein DPMN_092240 [Dreissena polymorpha]
MLKQIFWLAWSMWAGRPRIDRIVIREVQYQLEVNRCRNEEVYFKGSSANNDGRTDRRRKPVDLSINLKEDGNQAAFALINGPGIDRVVIRDFQGSSANSVGGDSVQDGQTIQYPHAWG